MSLSTEEFHADLEAATHRAARRQTLTALAQSVLLIALVVWTLLLAQQTSAALDDARAVQRVTAEQNRLQTVMLCDLAAQQANAPAGCDAYVSRP